MLISRVNPYTETVHEIDLPIIQADYNDWLLGKKSAHEAFPYLPKDLFLFFMEGIPPEMQPDEYDVW